jgi:hypothetical protein
LAGHHPKGSSTGTVAASISGPTAASVQALEPSQRSVDKSVALLFEKAGLDVGQFQSVTGSSD